MPWAAELKAGNHMYAMASGMQICFFNSFFPSQTFQTPRKLRAREWASAHPFFNESRRRKTKNMQGKRQTVYSARNGLGKKKKKCKGRAVCL